MFTQASFHLFDLDFYPTTIDGIVFTAKDAELPVGIDFSNVIGCKFLGTHFRGMDDESPFLAQSDTDTVERSVPI